MEPQDFASKKHTVESYTYIPEEYMRDGDNTISTIKISDFISSQPVLSFSTCDDNNENTKVSGKN